MHLHSVRQNRLATFVRGGDKGMGKSRRGAESAMRAMRTAGVYEFVARISAERTRRRMDTRDTALCGAAASRCHRRQHSSYIFPVLPVQSRRGCG